jgi:cytochrome c553
VTLPIAAYGASAVQQEYDDVLRSKPDMVHGEALFATCAACHSADGAGVPDGSVPTIGGQHFRVIVRELVDFRYDKRWNTLMEHVADEHNLGAAQDVADVALYISALKPGETPGTGSGESAAAGAQLYARACASCHGRTGNGDDRSSYPKLARQHYEYLIRQMDDAVEGRRPNFSREHVRLLARVERDDRAAIADYLSRISPR